jgi:hypothetical protein
LGSARRMLVAWPGGLLLCGARGDGTRERRGGCCCSRRLGGGLGLLVCRRAVVEACGVVARHGSSSAELGAGD